MRRRIGYDFDDMYTPPEAAVSDMEYLQPSLYSAGILPDHVVVNTDAYGLVTISRSDCSLTADTFLRAASSS